MKEMPERIYLFDCNNAMIVKLEGDTEYIRKDSFIEKVCAFLKDRIEHDSIDYPMATMHLIDDFQKFMEEQA